MQFLRPLLHFIMKIAVYAVLLFFKKGQQKNVKVSFQKLKIY